MPVAWTGTEVLATGQDQASVVLYDPATDTWRTAAPAPCAMDPGGYEQSAWLDERYVTACGRDALQVYDVASDTWRTIEAGSAPLNHREGSAIAWTGTDLIVWSGTVSRAGNPTPNSGKSIRLGPSVLSTKLRTHHAVEVPAVGDTLELMLARVLEPQAGA